MAIPKPMHKGKNPQLLQDMRDFFSDPSRWGKGALFLSREGQMCAVPESEHAHACCLLGAMYVFGDVRSLDELLREHGKEMQLLAEEIVSDRPTMEGYRLDDLIWRFNDSTSTTYKNVIDLLNRALLRK